MDINWPDSLPRAGNLQLGRVESVSPWFEIYKVNNDTYALLEPRHYEEVISYLILGDERAALFDSGMGIANIRAEIEQLTDLPVTVINSHCHHDHIGGNFRFQEIWAFNDNFEIARIEKGYTHGECETFMQPHFYLNLPAGFDLASYRVQPSRVTRRLRHLETIDLGGRKLTVHHTPGETPGSICLYDSRRSVLFTGDTFYPGTIWAHLGESDFERYRDSLRHLCSLLNQVSHLCPAHNEAYVPKEMLIRAWEGFEQIAAGQITGEVESGCRLYRFESFNVTLPLLLHGRNGT